MYSAHNNSNRITTSQHFISHGNESYVYSKLKQLITNQSVTHTHTRAHARTHPHPHISGVVLMAYYYWNKMNS